MHYGFLSGFIKCSKYSCLPNIEYLLQNLSGHCLNILLHARSDEKGSRQKDTGILHKTHMKHIFRKPRWNRSSCHLWWDNINPAISLMRTRWYQGPILNGRGVGEGGLGGGKQVMEKFKHTRTHFFTALLGFVFLFVCRFKWSGRER